MRERVRIATSALVLGAVTLTAAACTAATSPMEGGRLSTLPVLALCLLSAAIGSGAVALIGHWRRSSGERGLQPRHEEDSHARVIEYLREHSLSRPEEILREPLEGRDDLTGQVSRWLSAGADEYSKLLRYKDLLQRLPIPVLEIDADYAIKYINNACAKIVSLSPGQCIGRKCHDLMCTDDCKSQRCAPRRAMVSRKAENSQTRAHLAEGLQPGVPIDYTAVPILSPDGTVVGAFEAIVDLSSVYDVVGPLRNAGSTLSSASTEVEAQTLSIASAGEEIHGQTTAVKDAAEAMQREVSVVAAAVEEMSATLTEISSNTTKAASVADDASAGVHQANEAIQELGKLARKITKVSDSISDIADQTKLLALNATIEAASAGDHGRGFAVVASEVKELAKQTAVATQEISDQVHSVQAQTSIAVQAVANILTTIDEMQKYAEAISCAVEEQSSAAMEIGQSIANSAESASQTLVGIEEIESAVGENARGQAHLSEAAEDLMNLAASLKELVDRFQL